MLCHKIVANATDDTQSLVAPAPHFSWSWYLGALCRSSRIALTVALPLSRVGTAALVRMPLGRMQFNAHWHDVMNVSDGPAGPRSSRCQVYRVQAYVPRAPSPPPASEGASPAPRIVDPGGRPSYGDAEGERADDSESSIASFP